MKSSQQPVDIESELRVLHIGSTLDSGGIATSLWHLLPTQRRLVSSNNGLIAAAVLYETGQYGLLLINDGIPVYDLHFGHKYSPLGLWRLYSLVRRGRYNVIHAHGWPAVLFVALISFLNQRPRYILSEHNVTNRRRRLHLKFLDRFIYRRFDAVPAVSQAAAEALIAWLPETRPKVCVIHNGLDVARLYNQAGLDWSDNAVERPQEPFEPDVRERIRHKLGVPAGSPLLFAAGSLEHRKGIDILLQALALLNQAGPATVIAGDGPLRVDLEQLAKDLGVASQVQFLGFRPDLPTIMATADLFVLSSRWEGCPMVVLEAMALARPIAATAVGGVPELLNDGQSGRLVPAESPDILSRTIEEMLADQACIDQMGKQARQRLMASFQVEQKARHMLLLYEGKGLNEVASA